MLGTKSTRANWYNGVKCHQWAEPGYMKWSGGIRVRSTDLGYRLGSMASVHYTMA